MNESYRDKRRRTFVVYTQDKPDVLNRTVSVLRRRGFAIDSLSVGRSERPGLLRMTIVAEVDELAARRVEANLYKVIDVMSVEEVTADATVSRDLALIKVRANHRQRARVLQIAEVFRARALDVATESLILEITGSGEKIKGLIQVLEPFGLVSVARSGTVAMRRGAEPSNDGYGVAESWASPAADWGEPDRAGRFPPALVLASVSASGGSASRRGE